MFSARTGIECHNSPSILIDTCSIISNGFSAGTGIEAGNATNVIATDISGLGRGIRHQNVGLFVHGRRFEVNNIGIIVGQDQDGNNFTRSTFTSLACRWK